MFHGTSSIYAKEIKREGFNPSLSGFGQSQLSGLGLFKELESAIIYAVSTAKNTGGIPVVLHVEIPNQVWVDLRSYNLPMDIYDRFASEAGVNVDNFADFRIWFKPFNSDIHPYALTKMLLQRGFSGAIIDSTLGPKHPAPEFVLFNPNDARLIDQIQVLQANPSKEDYYLEMFKGLPMSQDEAKILIRDAIDLWRRRDRITYVLKIDRYMHCLAHRGVPQCDRVIRNYEKKYGILQPEGWSAGFPQLNHYLQFALHQNAQGMLDLVWQDQSLSRLLSQLQDLEETFLEEQKEESRWFIPEDEDESGPILEFQTQKFYWIMLSDSSSRQEAQSMGHCGVSAVDNSLLLSLRERGGNGQVRSHLTFAWYPISPDKHKFSGWGILGERKGYKNSKPASEYHPFIIALLRLSPIQVLCKSSYKPESDFSLNDLNYKQRETLLKEKPQLASWKFVSKEKLAELFKKIGQSLTEAGEDIILYRIDSKINFVQKIIRILDPSWKLKENIESALPYVSGDKQLDFYTSDMDPDLNHWVGELKRRNLPLYKKMKRKKLSRAEIQGILINAEVRGFETGTFEALAKAIDNLIEQLEWRFRCKIVHKPYDGPVELRVAKEHLGDFLDTLAFEEILDLKLGSDEILEALIEKDHRLRWSFPDNEYDSEAAYEAFEEELKQLLA